MKRILLNLALLVLIAIPTAAQPTINPPTNIVTAVPDATWKNWINNPLYVSLAVQATNVQAVSNSTYSVTLADLNLEGVGLGCPSYFTNTPVEAAHTRLNGFYTLTVVGTNLASFEITLDVNYALALVDTRRLSSIFPKTYTIMVDGSPANYVSDSNPSGCAYYSNTWTIQVIQDRQPASVNTQCAVYNDSNFPDSAPGDGVWARIGPAKSALTNHCAMDWSVSLGHLVDGYSAGRVYFREDCLNSNTYMPGILLYAAESTNIQNLLYFVTDPSTGAMRQISAPQTFVDIVLTNYESDVRFYTPSSVGPQTNSSGVFTNITGTPFVTWQIQNPDQNWSISNRIRVVENRSSYMMTNQIVYNSTNKTWTLTQGSGTTQRVETRTISFPSATNRTETVTVQYAGSGLDYKGTETYEIVSGDWQIAQAVEDPDGSALTTTFSYYNDGIVTDDGQIQSITYPDGRWEVRDYDPDTAELLSLFEPYMDLPANASSVSSFDPSVTGYSISGPGKFTYYYSDPSLALTRLCAFPSAVEYQDESYLYQDNNDGTATAGQIKTDYEYPGEFYNVGATSLEYTAQAGAGLNGHLFWAQPTRTHATQFYYYDGGIFSNSTGVFTVTNTGSDWRMTEVYGTCVASSIGDTYTSIGSHPVPGSVEDYYPVFDLVRNKSTKEVTIWRAGTVLEKDSYVYTGGDANTNPTFVLLDRKVYTPDSIGHTTNITRVDPVSGASRAIYSADWKGANTFDTDLKYSETDETGMQVLYGYDSMKRVASITTNGISGGSFPAQSSIVTATLYNSRGETLSVSTSAGGLTQNTSWLYDLAGRVTSFTDTNGLATTYSYQNGGLQITQTNPGGATIITDHYLDGQVKSRTGTGMVAEYHFYDTGQNDPTTYMGSGGVYGRFQIASYDSVHYGSASSTRYVTNCFGFLGTLIESIVPDFSGTSSDYQVTLRWGQLLNGMVTNGMAPYYINRDCFDNICTTGRHIDGSATGFGPFALSASSDDGFLTNGSGYEEISGTWYQVTTNQVCLIDENGTLTTLSTVLQQVNNLPSGVKLITTSNDFYGKSTVYTIAINPSTKTVTQTTQMPSSTLVATNIAVNGLLESSSTSTVGVPSLYSYDALRRQTSVQTPLGFSTSTSYDSATGRVTATTDPAGNTTTYQYYSSSVSEAGRLQTQTAANNAHTYYDYDLLGHTTRIWGDMPYPQAIAYDMYGEITNLQTFRGGSGWTGSSWPSGSAGTPDVTTWSYQDSSGLLTNKTDAQGHSVSYTYVNNMLYTRVWGRGVGSTNIYNSAGDLTEIDYSDGTPSIVFGSFSRADLPRTITDAAGTRSLTNDPLNQLVADTGTSGLFNGVAVNNHFNSLNQRDVLKETGLGTTLETDYTFDGVGRMNLVTFGPSKAAYGYLANSGLLQTTAFTNSSSAVLTTTRQWNYGFQLSSIANTANGATVTSDNYLYDNLNRRTRSTLEDSSYWSYAYNNRNELTGANRYWSDFTPVTGQQYGYGFDNIGNRSSAQVGSVGNMSTVSYTVNSLNEYTGIATPGTKDILGLAIATNSVTVNGATADRKGEYYHSQISIFNSSGPLWQQVTNTTGTSSVGGGFAFPGSSATSTYDADGNLTFDGIWNYQWDGENRLISMNMTNIAAVVYTNRMRLDFKYDYMNRRISKVVSTYNGGSTFVAQSTNYFVYDGWNLIGVFIPGGMVKQSFVWGLDLSATISGAGGIGGLLMMTNSGTNYFTSYDGNGNITGLINATDKSTVARYEYSPFGETLRATGPVSGTNQFRFSTKFCDIESGLDYYGYRYYNPSQGRWLGRDTQAELVELAAMNVYGWCGNNPLSNCDPDGQSWKSFGELLATTAVGIGSGAASGFLTGAGVGALSGAIAGGVSGLCQGISGTISGKSFGQMIAGAAEYGAMSGIAGGLGTTFGAGGWLAGNLLQGAGNAYLSGSKTWQTYAVSMGCSVALSGLVNCCEGAGSEALSNASLSLAGSVGVDVATAVALVAEP